MFFNGINYITVIVAAVASMGLGFLWYSPYAFGRRWIKEMEMTPEEMATRKERNSNKGMVKTYALWATLSIVTSFIFAALLNSLVVVGFSGLLVAAFCMWLGFSLPLAANNTLFDDDSIVLTAINAGYQLASFIVIALIVGIFG
jgi:hypothetical protein